MWSSKLSGEGRALIRRGFVRGERWARVVEDSRVYISKSDLPLPLSVS